MTRRAPGPVLVGVFSDAHGCPGAFERAVEVLRAAGAGPLIFLGDAVGYVPDTTAVAALLASGIPAVRGNHEAMLIGGGQSPEQEAVYRFAPVRERLTAGELAALAALPASRTAGWGDTRCLFVHGSPADPTFGYVYPDTPLDGFEISADVVFMGNTHRPFVRAHGGRLFVNVGSCALPRDDDARAAVVLFDTTARTAEILRYDIADLARSTLLAHAVHPSVAACLARAATGGGGPG